MDLGINGRWALVCGASKGLGLGCAQALAAEGVNLLIVARGGGSLEDLWAFNDEQLARTIVQSPVPLVSGVGHETDFTIADFCADLRAPTPTAAAELVAQPREVWLGALDLLADRLESAVQRQIDLRHQRLDQAAQRLEPKFRVVKVDTEQAQDLAARYAIRSIPTLMIFKGGQRVDMVVGAVPKTTLAKTLEGHL